VAICSKAQQDRSTSSGVAPSLPSPDLVSVLTKGAPSRRYGQEKLRPSKYLGADRAQAGTGFVH